MIRDEDGDGREASGTETVVNTFGREVMGAYDQLDGRDAFVIAELECDHAWIAVPEGTEIDVGDWE